MEFPFGRAWRARRGTARGVAVFGHGDAVEDPEQLAGLLGDCRWLRERAERHGIALDDSEESLAALDQLVPTWRDDGEAMTWLGNDAGLYLGTVIVRTVSGARWQVWPNGHPVVRLASGREIDTAALGHQWAETGSPELSQTHAEAAED